MISIHTMVLTDGGDFEPLTETEYRHWHPSIIEGAVILEVDGREVWGTEFWDDVSALWPYLLNAARDCRELGRGETSLPDQPVKLGMEQVAPGMLELRIWVYQGEELSRVVVFADEFWTALREGFDEFVEHAERLGLDVDLSYRLYQERIRDW